MRRGAVMPGLACAALLAGCGVLRGLEDQQPAPWVQAGAPQPASDAESLMLYFQHVRKLPGAELGREHETARQAYARARSDFNRVRLAMVLALPNAPFGDEPRALELLDPVAKNPNGRLQGLAYVLASHLQERRRLDASAQGLQQKLDALMSLERSMIERKR
ncbi:MAG: hypothetical protein HYV99_00785 [Betaproteobacteria bacterium]|nr:hypothetical protein [Betaproteobacteria bacterium]MBI2508574.1 hypothetical protein [Betaproteobacteria bacterium]